MYTLNRVDYVRNRSISSVKSNLNKKNSESGTKTSCKLKSLKEATKSKFKLHLISLSIQNTPNPLEQRKKRN